MPVTFGLGPREKIDRVVIDWPSGRTEEYQDLRTGKTYNCIETKGIEPQEGF